MMRLLVCLCVLASGVQGVELKYAPAPVDNPLKGLVPYVGSSGKAQFPHTMEFRYFAWKDLMTGRNQYDWTRLEKTLDEVSGRGNFMPAMKAAGAEDKWKRFPIGGEIRPELWKKSFTDSPHPKGQDFAESVRKTHVTWLMDSGLFEVRFPVDLERKARAMKEVARMGYELHVSAVRIEKGELVVTVENRGVAPFYCDWPVEVQYSAPNIRTKPVSQVAVVRSLTQESGATVTGWRRSVKLSPFQSRAAMS